MSRHRWKGKPIEGERPEKDPTCHCGGHSRRDAKKSKSHNATRRRMERRRVHRRKP